MSKPTPGPWSIPHFADDAAGCNCASVLSEGYAGSICSVSINNGKPVAEGGNDAPPLEEALANARLIAAAPEMLHLLRQARRRWLDAARAQEYWAPQEKDDLRRIDSTIAKAEGSSL